ncbi:MAG: 50S ribosomal protein L31, partial [Chloroflexaceae bacterium]|nr:50S ribosomal protein L31 [Chloroflexaceae bacterium]
PKYHTTDIVCGTCGTVWPIGSTRANLRVNICSNCHPFYTGEQRMIIDAEGQVDRFMKRLQVSQERQAAAARRRQNRTELPRKKSLLEEIYGEENAPAEQEEPASQE